MHPTERDIQHAVYTMHNSRDGNEEVLDKEICYSYLNRYSSYFTHMEIFPGLSFSKASNLVNFKECIRIAREVLPREQLPTIKEAKRVWNDGWIWDLETTPIINIFQILCIWRYPQEQEARWKVYKMLWGSGRYTSRYLCYVASQFGYYSKDRYGVTDWRNDACLSGVHSEFDEAGPAVFFSQWKRRLHKQKPEPKSNGWKNAHSFFGRTPSISDDRLSYLTHMKSPFTIADELHYINDFKLNKGEVE